MRQREGTLACEVGGREYHRAESREVKRSSNKHEEGRRVRIRGEYIKKKRRRREERKEDDEVAGRWCY